MSVPFLLTPAQMERIRPHFPRSRGIPRVDDCRVLSGIIVSAAPAPFFRGAV
jgi:transposase